MATIRLDPLVVKKFSGLNLDISEEKMSPGSFITLTNMKTDVDGDLKRVNGCTLQKDVSGVSNALKMSLYPTRSGKYIVTYHQDKKIRIYTWPDFTEITYQTDDPDIDSIEINEIPWFAVHNGELYIGNMADGIWRWRDGNQPLMRGSAPNNIIVQLGEEEGIEEKVYDEWEFAYDYEKNGGRSPLSRRARIRFYSNKLTAKIIMDTPPLGSKGRRVYARYNEGTDDSPSWSDWYYVKEVTNNDSLNVILDSELVHNISDETKYDEDTANAMSPHARFGVAYGGRLWVGHTANSPSEMLYSEIGKPYINYTNAFDLKDPLTNLVVFSGVVASGLNRISVCQDEPKRMDPISIGIGAFENSMAVVNNKLYFVNEYGWLEYSSKGLKRIGTDEYLSADDLKAKEGLISGNFTGLKKPKRIILITDQGDYEAGEYHEGVSSDVFPGALSLQQNIVSGIAGIFDEHRTESSDWLKTDSDSCCQSFQIPGSITETVLVDAISIYLDKFDQSRDPDPFIGELRQDDPTNPGYPDMTTEGLLSEFKGDTKGEIGRHFDKFPLVENKTIYRGTTYWLVIPKRGSSNSDWEIYGNDWNESPMYMRGRFWYSPGGGSDWEKHPHLQDICFRIHGKAANALIDRNTGGDPDITLESRTYTRAFKLEVDVEEVELDLLEIFVHKEGSPAAVSTAAIHEDNSGEPGDKVYDIPTFTEVSDPIGGDWDENPFTLQAEFSSGKTLSKGTYWVVLPEIGTGGSDYYKWYLGDDTDDGSLRSDDGGSTWETESQTRNVWFKLWASRSYEAYASSGYWVSQKFTIGANDDYDKVFWSRMVPKGATAKLYIDEDESGSWTEITSSTPYSVTADTTILQFKVELSLGTANFTPTVDSILVTFTKENDEGDVLYAGNVNGEFYLSRVDDDGDGSDEFTLVLSKMDTVHKLSEPFYDFLPVAEKTTLGIGKNTNDDLNIYELDKGSKWYYNDTGNEKDIDSEIETGRMMYDSLLKHFRKIFLHLKANSSSELYIEFITGGGELLAQDEIIAISPHRITINKKNARPIPFSLPDRMQGSWFKIRITGDDADWGLHGFELYSYGKTGRLITLAGSGEEEVILKQVNTTSLVEPWNEDIHNGHLYVGTDIWEDLCARIAKYKIELNGDLTLISTNKVAQLPGTVFQIHVTDDYVYMGGNGLYIYDHDFSLVGNTAVTGSCSGGLVVSDDELHGWGCYGSTTKKLLYFDLSNKSSPGLATASEDYIFRQPLYHNGYIFVLDKTNGYLRVYDASTPNSVPYSEVGAVNLSETGDFYSLICDEARDLLYYSGVNYFGIIDVSDPTNPTVVVESSSLSIPRYWIGKKGRYIFGADQANSKMIVGDTVDYRSIEAESYLAYSLGATTPAPYKNLKIDEMRNLLFYTSRDTNVIEVFKIFGI